MSADPAFATIKACVFDAYGTVYDFNSAAARCKDVLGDKADKLSELWRAKQLQYTWLRSLMGQYAKFWQVTGEALDYSMAALGITDRALYERLMGLYERLETFPEVMDVLKHLRGKDMRLAILSNGSREMLDAVAENSGVAPLLDANLSVDEIGVFKPDMRIYRLACDRLGVKPEEICFLSSNAWDAVGGAAFGYRVAWVNRYKQPRERLPAQPHAELTTLRELPALLGL